MVSEPKPGGALLFVGDDWAEDHHDIAAYPDIEVGPVLKAFPDIELGQVLKIHRGDLDERPTEGDTMGVVILRPTGRRAGLSIATASDDPHSLADSLTELPDAAGALTVMVLDTTGWAVTVSAHRPRRRSRPSPAPRSGSSRAHGKAMRARRVTSSMLCKLNWQPLSFSQPRSRSSSPRRGLRVARRRGVPASVWPVIRAVPEHPRGPHDVWRWEGREVEFIPLDESTG
jgi:hypothetical protein